MLLLRSVSLTRNRTLSAKTQCRTEVGFTAFYSHFCLFSREAALTMIRMQSNAYYRY